ncbi:DUF72 domain-containing protein [Micrococcus porci]|uniref:DUF72 domain-containing protein n=1 Tax=Micrococcus porci TaxID=2856555 RepID=UPI003CEFA750
MDVRIGTSGWTYMHWRGTFYPQGLRISDQLDHYTERFRTVELNGSHYRWPADSTVEAWRERLPAGFEMAVKASRYLTHYRKLNEPQDWVERILHTLDLLRDHAGPLLLQLPANLHRDDGRLAGFLGLLPERVRVTVEVQHESWLDEDVFDLFDRHGAGFVVSVIAGREPVLRARASRLRLLQQRQPRPRRVQRADAAQDGGGRSLTRAERVPSVRGKRRPSAAVVPREHRKADAHAPHADPHGPRHDRAERGGCRPRASRGPHPRLAADPRLLEGPGRSPVPALPRDHL